MKKIKLNNEKKFEKIIYRNIISALDDFFKKTQKKTFDNEYCINPFYTLGTISDLFRIIEILNNGFYLKGGKKHSYSRKEKKEKVDSILSYHSGNTEGFIIGMLKTHYPNRKLIEYIFKY